MSRVAVIGTGLIGTVLTGHLAEAGHDVHVWNRSRERTAGAVERGGTVEDSPRAAARGAELVIIVVADDTAVHEVLTGDDGVVAGLATGAVVADMSTTTPASKVASSALVEASGAGFLDAPFFGSMKEALERGLWPVIGGNADVLASARPFLETFSDQIFHAGPVGAAATVKLAGNLLVGTMVQHLSESISLIEGAGGDPAVLLELLGITGFRSPIYQAKGRQMVDDDFEPRGNINTAVKDLTLIISVLESMGLRTGGLEGVRDSYKAAQSAGLGERDFASVISIQRPNATN